MADKRRHTRRRFLRQATTGAAATIVAPYFVPARVLGAGGATPPSDRIVMGVIGQGGMGRHNLGEFMNDGEVQMVALCDVDRSHLDGGLAAVKEKYGNDDCQGFGDFRELLAVDGLEAVAVVTPDHWHALITIAAADAGKDIYCEKPLANSVAEGRAMCDAVQRNNVVLQCGSHERSTPNVRRACELVRNGRLGRIHTVRINLPCDEDHHRRAMELDHVPPPMPVPAGFDYNFWLGHAPEAPYTEMRCSAPLGWRFILDYGGGEMTDRGAHIIDIAQLALGTDDTGPVEFSAKGTASTTSLFNAFFDFEFENVYASGVRMLGTSKHGPRGVGFEGDGGKLFVHVHGGALEAEPASLIEGEDSGGAVQLGRTPSHRRNFLDAVRSREATFATAEIGHRTATICHLNNIALRLGKSFKWDPAAERTDDDEANAWLTPTMRAPWKLT
jgi:predicted dehydrogenase